MAPLRPAHNLVVAVHGISLSVCTAQRAKRVEPVPDLERLEFERRVCGQGPADDRPSRDPKRPALAVAARVQITDRPVRPDDCMELVLRLVRNPGDPTSIGDPVRRRHGPAWERAEVVHDTAGDEKRGAN